MSVKNQLIKNILEEYIIYLYTNFETHKKLKVTRITIGEVMYVKDVKTNKLYNLNTLEYAGIWNIQTKTIDIDDEDEDEDEDEDDTTKTKCDLEYVLKHLKYNYDNLSYSREELNFKRIVKNYGVDIDNHIYNFDINSEEYKEFYWKLYYYEKTNNWYDNDEQNGNLQMNYENDKYKDFEYDVDKLYKFMNYSDYVYNIQTYFNIISYRRINDLLDSINEILDSLNTSPILK